MIDETLYVVDLTPEVVEEHKKIVESVGISFVKEIPACQETTINNPTPSPEILQVAH